MEKVREKWRIKFQAIPQMKMITTQLNEENFPMSTLEKKQ
jgi:hypothetical protein